MADESAWTKQKIKSRIEENELDLSLCGISKIPVQNMLPFTKITVLDLSCNKINAVPESFVKLNQLIQIDLSKNSITELPYNFGELTKLKRLDLFQNHLEELPVSFCKLTNLQWLDLKANPIQESMQPIVGDCLKPIDCQRCATNVGISAVKIVSHYHKVNLQKLEEKQKELKKEQKRVDKLRKDEEKIRQRKKEEKKKRQEEQKLIKVSKQNEDKKTLKSHSIDKGAQLCNDESMLRQYCHVYLLFFLVIAAALLFLYAYKFDTQQFLNDIRGLKERILFFIETLMSK